MPFDPAFDDVYQTAIKPTAEACGVLAERVDEQVYTETILERIYRQIEQADFIIADMTGQNPNVFYEVGYAHAKKKLTTLITKDASDIPFDLKHHRHIVYGSKLHELRKKLEAEIIFLKSESAKIKSELFACDINAGPGFLNNKDYFHEGSFDMELTITNKMNNRSPEIDTVYIYTSRNWEIFSDSNICPYSDNSDQRRQHGIPTSSLRIAAHAWKKIKLTVKGELWSKYKGNTKKEDSYTRKGVFTVEIHTTEGALRYDVPVEVNFGEIPF
jgi:hypothetical protein